MGSNQQTIDQQVFNIPTCSETSRPKQRKKKLSITTKNSNPTNQQVTNQENQNKQNQNNSKLLPNQTNQKDSVLQFHKYLINIFQSLLHHSLLKQHHGTCPA